MKRLKLLLFFIFTLACSSSYALLITDTIAFDHELRRDNYTFTFDLIPQGYNPATDTINWVSFSFDVREIIEDPFEDDGSMEEYREWVIIHDWFILYREFFTDMDTGVFTATTWWEPTDECRYGAPDFEGGECYFQPDQDGLFYSYWSVDTENLWLNSMSLTLDVTRKTVDEPQSLLLLISLLPLLILRSRKSFLSKQ